MARGIYEGYGAPLAGYGIRAYMLRYAACLACGYAAFTEGVKQRGLAVVHVAHYGNYRRAWYEVLLGIRLFNALVEHVLGGLGYVELQLYAVIGGDERAGVVVYLLIDGSHYAEYKQLLDDLGHRLAYFFGKILYGYGLGSQHGLVDLYRLRLM